MNIRQAIESLDYLVKAELTPFFWGHAGIGKTSIVKQYAKDKGFKFFAFYLGTQSDIGDILGLAEFVTNPDGTKSTAFATPKWLSDTIAYCNANPDSGAVIFLDEFNRGRRDILSGMFSLALDKTFHMIKLPKNCHVIAAGNPPTDEYFVTDVNETALMARFVHIKLEPTFEEWVTYAQNTGIDSSLIGFLKNQPELLEASRTDFQLPVKVDRRAYERLNRLFTLKTPSHLMEQLMAGIIGLERTVAYLQYVNQADKPLAGTAILDGTGASMYTAWSNPDNTLSSLLNLTCDNLKETVLARTVNFTNEEKQNIMKFFDVIPKDISFPLIKALVQAKNSPGYAVFRDFFVDKAFEQKMVGIVKAAKPEEQKTA